MDVLSQEKAATRQAKVGILDMQSRSMLGVRSLYARGHVRGRSRNLNRLVCVCIGLERENKGCRDDGPRLVRSTLNIRARKAYCAETCRAHTKARG